MNTQLNCEQHFHHPSFRCWFIFCIPVCLCACAPNTTRHICTCLVFHACLSRNTVNQEAKPPIVRLKHAFTGSLIRAINQWQNKTDSGCTVTQLLPRSVSYCVGRPAATCSPEDWRGNLQCALMMTHRTYSSHESARIWVGSHTHKQTLITIWLAGTLSVHQRLFLCTLRSFLIVWPRGLIQWLGEMLLNSCT